MSRQLRRRIELRCMQRRLPNDRVRVPEAGAFQPVHTPMGVLTGARVVASSTAAAASLNGLRWSGGSSAATVCDRPAALQQRPAVCGPRQTQRRIAAHTTTQ